MSFVFNNSYAHLPPRFYVRQSPVPVLAPRLVRLNRELAGELGLDLSWLASPEGIAVLAGNHVPAGAEPLAMAYAGHQFGGFVPQLGDGRAILLGEVLSPEGERFDIQLKGSGRTFFSRGGDGRAWLGPVLREFIMGEAMHALGIPTTRALAAVATGEPVFRDEEFPGAVLTRVARSHVRVGTFEYFAARQDTEALRQLADYVIARHYPEAGQSDRPYRALLVGVINRQADLIARWLAVGFIHGVMNTDNMSIAGETIDYGPCAFMDTFHPERVYSSIDRDGRYAYGNQPQIAHWNLLRLAECLLPLLDEDQGKAREVAQAAIDAFPGRFKAAHLERFRAKLGLTVALPDDSDLISDLLQVMAESHADFTNGFRALCDAAVGSEAGFLKEFGDCRAAKEWLRRWRVRWEQEPMEADLRASRMRRTNPAVIPRNHRVEAALAAALEQDLGPLDQLLRVLASPWDDQAESFPYRSPPEPHEVVHQTFCGT
jgi:uncharacterized protein YdiU (UPF0061 family)